MDLQRTSGHPKYFFDLSMFGQVVTSCRPTSRQRSRRRSFYHFTYTFVPPMWLSNMILHWDLRLQKMLHSPPRISLSLVPIRYNPSRELKAAVIDLDTSKLHRLFRDGLAHPTDHIVQRRPITLFEVGPKVPLEVVPSNFAFRHSLPG